jgi:hypothetical protein
MRKGPGSVYNNGSLTQMCDLDSQVTSNYQQFFRTVRTEEGNKKTINLSPCLNFFLLLARKPNLEKKFYLFKQILS